MIKPIGDGYGSGSYGISGYGDGYGDGYGSGSYGISGYGDGYGYGYGNGSDGYGGGFGTSQKIGIVGAVFFANNQPGRLT